MGKPRANLIGQKFNSLTVLSFEGVKNDRTMWLCKCNCGNETCVSQNNLTRGTATSCGCSRRKPKPEGFAKHNLCGTPIYTVWIDIRRRCEDSRVDAYKHYGEVGVKVCNEWKDVKNFNEWCISNNWKKGMHVCRKDDVGDYSPENCYIATSKQNSRDRKSNKLNIVRAMVIRNLRKNTNLSCDEIGKLYRVKPSTIQNVISNNTWVN